MLDFDQWYILAAFILAVFSIKGYRLIATVLFVNFMISEAAAISILKALGGPEGDPAWPLYATFSAISMATAAALVYLKASPPLYVIMLLYSGYNLLAVIEFPMFQYVEIKWFNDNRESVAEAQMTIELTFMFIICKGPAYVWSLFKPDSKYHYFIDRFFSHSFRMGSKRLA
ncbi:MAG: hypothetical protein O7D95_06460 [Betaproteobacteria bacterium]|nr:hypothetical protein [Betaproteobacteria bacterium]